MDDYIIFICPKCKTIRYARMEQKTAKCLKCSYQIRIQQNRIMILAKAKNAREAVEIVKSLKARLKKIN